MPRRIEDFRGLTQASRVKLLHAVQRLPGRKLQELAEEAGIHINTAREHLHVLEEEGLVTSRPVSTGTRGRPPVVFDPVRHPRVNPHADRRAAQATSKGDLLRRIAPALDQTDELGVEAQHQVDTLYSHLEDAGLEPEVHDDGLGMDMRPCAYHDMLEDYGTVVCSVHMMLIRDHLTQVPGPLRLRSLEPFVESHRCRLTLGEAGAASDAEILPGDYRPTGRAGSNGAPEAGADEPAEPAPAP